MNEKGLPLWRWPRPSVCCPSDGHLGDSKDPCRFDSGVLFSMGAKNSFHRILDACLFIVVGRGACSIKNKWNVWDVGAAGEVCGFPCSFFIAKQEVKRSADLVKQTLYTIIIDNKAAFKSREAVLCIYLLCWAKVRGTRECGVKKQAKDETQGAV